MSDEHDKIDEDADGNEYLYHKSQNDEEIGNHYQ